MNNKLRVFEAFAGVGSQRMALRNLGIDHEVVGIAEIDKFALKSYEAIHGDCPNFGDISKLDPSELPDMDLFTYSFPCQDLSVAGKQAGLGKGTRSGLLYECEKVIENKKPKYLLLENVKNLVGKKFKPEFDKWLEYLEGLGYTNYWKVLNAKDYGVPQNRERVFVVSILNDVQGFEFKEKVELDKRIKDILENEVEEKYYINKEFKILNTKFENKNKPNLIGGIGDVNFGKQFRQGNRIYDGESVAMCLTAQPVGNSGGNSYLYALKDDIKLNQIAELNIKGNDQIRRIYDKEGLCPTINTMQGGHREPKILIPQATKKGYIEMEVGGVRDLTYPNSKTRRGRVQEGGNICPTLTAVRQDIVRIEKVVCEYRRDEGFRFFKGGLCGSLRTIDACGDKRVIEYDGNKVDLPCIAASRGRNPENTSDRTIGGPTEQMLGINTKSTSNTITTVQKDNHAIEENYRVRKLTPLECWRLMGFSDEDFYKAKNVGISNSQLYKQAGNSIVVNVLEGIFENLLK